MADHDKFSFSGSSRWLEDACPASIWMSAGYPNGTSPAAELGTAVHMLGEQSIIFGFDPVVLLGENVYNHEVDQQMVDGATMYKSWSDKLTLQYGVRPHVEKRVEMQIEGHRNIFGTADLIHIDIPGRTLHVSDYKNGRGPVEVSGNSQCGGYSAATMDTFNLWGQIDRVFTTIIQPNYQHVDGPIRTAELTPDEVWAWKQKFTRSVHLVNSRSTKPNAGPWCQYCPASVNCRARLMAVLQTAYTDDNLDNIPLNVLEIMLNEIKGVETWLKRIQARALTEARRGHQFETRKLVKARSRAKCKDETAFIKRVKEDRPDINIMDLYQDPMLRGKTVVSKLLGRAMADEYFEMPPMSTTLEVMSDNRPAIRPEDVEKVFEPVGVPAFKEVPEGTFPPLK